jgi:hypothetical protein
MPPIYRSGPFNTYNAIPIVSRQRLASIQAEAVSILIVRQPLTLGTKTRLFSENTRFKVESVLRFLTV